MLPVAGRPSIAHVFERASRAKMLDRLVLASPLNDGVDIHGSFESCPIVYHPSIDENDLIGRFYHVAEHEEADVVVRLCGDNLMVEPGEIDRAVQYFLEQPRIFVSNMHQHKIGRNVNGNIEAYENDYPDGIGCEVFSMSTLKWMNEYIKDPALREHPHIYFHNHGMLESPSCPRQFARPSIKLDVNTEKDYEFVKDIFDALYPKDPNFHIIDVLAYLDKKKCLAG